MTATEFKSYSQYGEDSAIITALGDHVGAFLDIGAWDPKAFSNSRALYERGWSGVMIEPSPGPFLTLMREYGNDARIRLIHAALGTERSLAEFWCTDDAVSTTERANYEAWKDHAKFLGRFYVPVITLADVFNQFAPPGGFNFVNIDTEGTSGSVLVALLETPAFPKCICVEHDGHVVELTQAAQAKGYR